MPSLDHNPQEIPLTQGQIAIVCAHDYERLSQYKWQAVPMNKSGGVSYYACHAQSKRPFRLYMHRIVNDTPADKITDHKDRHTLNNTCDNLRSIDHLGNAHNRTLHVRNTTGVSGVYWYKSRSMWTAQIYIDKHRRTLGYYTSKNDAITARKQAEGEFWAS